ncbi:hypothetical protein LMG27177_06611 [Paraburkholderia fynbosensis]|uniref:Uncharacterized protein n=1 Tax=Paraburkholderia fynbosensis TaxID=1200993 RepID=A0A6J5GXQ9_9BURK|nr:hypothetical protein LMG27177_06611 [Paraburkholderia fynbosensis]
MSGKAVHRSMAPCGKQKMAAPVGAAIFYWISRRIAGLAPPGERPASQGLAVWVATGKRLKAPRHLASSAYRACGNCAGPRKRLRGIQRCALRVVGGAVPVAGTRVSGHRRMRVHGARRGHGVVRIGLIRHDRIRRLRLLDPASYLRDQIDVREALAAAAMGDPRHHVQPCEIAHARLAHRALHRLVVSDREERRDVLVGPAVPQDQLAAGAPECGQVGLVASLSGWLACRKLV